MAGLGLNDWLVRDTCHRMYNPNRTTIWEHRFEARRFSPWVKNVRDPFAWRKALSSYIWSYKYNWKTCERDISKGRRPDGYQFLTTV